MNNKLNIKVIRNKTPEQIGKLVEIESNKLNAFSSPIIQDQVTKDWISFIYYRTSDFQDAPVKPEPTPIQKKTEKSIIIYDEATKEPKKPFIPTKEQLERWKRTKLTKKTYGLLLSKGFSKEDIKNIKSQYEAHIILENLKEKNI